MREAARPRAAQLATGATEEAGDPPGRVRRRRRPGAAPPIAGLFAAALGALSGPRAARAHPAAPEDGHAAASAAAATWEERLHAAQERLVTDLGELADWATTRKLYAARDRIFEQILLFRPDDFRAHKGLKHTQDRDGNWHPPERAVKSRNYTKSALPELEEQHAALVEAYREICLELLAEAELDFGDPRAREVLHTVLWADPENAYVRELLGEVRDGEAWVLTETITGRERRKELEGFADQALSLGKEAVRVVEPSEEEQALGVAWGTVAATDDVRALGTGSPQEVRVAAQAAHAVGEYFRRVFELDTRHWPDTTLFLLADEASRDTFLEHHPKVPPDQRDFYRRLVGTGLPGTPDLAAWHPEPIQRLDLAARHVMGSFLQQAFGTTREDGWVWEGMGMYLTRSLTKTRLTFYGTYGDSEEVARLKAHLYDPGTNWRTEAHELLTGEDAPALAETLRKGLAEIHPHDTLVAYWFSAYLVEGRPGEAAQILKRVGEGGEPVDQVLAAVLGMPVSVIERRFVRWLDERR